MPVPLAQFIKTLADSGIMSPEEIRTFQERLPPEKLLPDDAQEFARELVSQKKLTSYQAAAVYQGQAQDLLLGTYVVLDKLGQGGMGMVFKAEHRRMKRIVAVKVISQTAMKSPDAVKRFRREVEAAARLTHPNIVAAHDAGEAAGVHFLVLEYVEGIDLSILVKKQGRLPVETALAYILQAARGLAHAHAEGIVHRDIKPANLLLDKSGTVKILDMGLARLTDSAGGPAVEGLTQSGSIMGTVDYMSPEQALDTKHADARSDIYSLGCSLYYLLTGRAVYAGDTLMKKLLAHREQSVPLPSAARLDVPASLDAMIQKFLAKRPEERYQTMTEVIGDLEACLAGGVVSATTAGPSWGTSPSPFQVAGSTTKGSDDPAVQDFLNAISPASSATHVRTRARTEPASETMASRVGEHTRTIEPASRSFPWMRVSTIQRTLIACGFAAILIVISIIWRPSRNTPGTRNGASRTNQPALAQKGSRGSSKDTSLPAVATPNAALSREEQKWMHDVAAMMDVLQVDTVATRLKKLNPEFDGKVVHKIDNHEVTELSFAADHVSDISPVRALTGLRSLTCRGVPGSSASPLKDLSALRGLALTHFDCGLTKVVDLSPLAGMALTHLSIYGTQVADLSPLTGMPLTHLSIQGAPIFDLSPLEGMPLTEFICTHSPVDGLSSLAGMPLQILLCSTGSVSDISPLRGMPLTQLDLTGSMVYDLSPLADMPTLGHLNLTGSLVSDISPLADLNLTHLYIGGAPVSDLSPLKNLPLKAIACDFVPERDAQVLRSITTLETINREPAGEFWKRIDAGQP